MSDDREAALDAMDRLLEEFEDDDAVAYAEVGGVYQEKTDLVVTGDGPRNRTAFTETGVWLRVFANGAADYRYTTSLDDESLRDVADRAIRSGEVLAQSEPGRFDAYTRHRATHGGWAETGLDTVDVDDVVDAIDAGLAHTEGLALERRWVDYTDAHIEEAMGTTTGSVVQTTLDRAQLAFSLTPVDGPKVRRHAGSTAGAAFLKTIPDCIAAAADDLERLVDADRASVDADGSLVSGESTVALSPRAAGQLFHLVAHALEADARYMGLSPYAVGDEIGPPALRIDDTVRAGSWAARAYDAEVRPTTPVTLVADGTVRRLLHNTTAAADHETEPAGHSVPSLGFTEPPRIHARHLEVARLRGTVRYPVAPRRVRAGAARRRLSGERPLCERHRRDDHRPPRPRHRVVPDRRGIPARRRNAGRPARDSRPRVRSERPRESLAHRRHSRDGHGRL
jgi:TldD protein